MAAKNGPLVATAAHRRVAAFCLVLATVLYRPVNGELPTELPVRNITAFSIKLEWTSFFLPTEIVVTNLTTDTPTEDSPFTDFPDPINEFTVYHLYPEGTYSIKVSAGQRSMVVTETTAANRIEQITNTPTQMVLLFPDYAVPSGFTPELVQIYDPLTTQTPDEVSFPLRRQHMILNNLDPGILYQFEVLFKSSGTTIVADVSQFRNAVLPPNTISFSNRDASSITITASQQNRRDYYKVVYRKGMSGQNLVERSQGDSVTLTNLETDTSYYIFVTSVAGIGGDRVESIGVQDSFTLISLDVPHRFSTVLGLSWGSVDSDHVGYELVYSPLGSSQEMSVIVYFAETVIGELIPGTEYSFQVYGSQNNVREGLITSAIVQTLPAAVTTFDIRPTETTITISWEPPVGQAEAYAVSYTPARPEGGETVISGTVYTITCLEPDTSYEIKVRSIQGGLYSADITDTQSRRAQTVAGEPGEINIVAIGPTDVTFTWNPVDNADFYDVSLLLDGGTVFTTRVEVDSPLRVVLTLLSGARSYEIRVDAAGTSVSKSRQISSAPTIPGFLTSQYTLSKDISLIWGTSTGASHYIITYFPTSDSANTVSIEVPSSSTAYEIRRLAPNTMYTVQVSGLLKGASGACVPVQSLPISKEFTTDACASTPCANGGQCISSTDGYNCVCRNGYQGPTCLVLVDACVTTPLPCLNNGECTPIGNSYQCTCLDGYIGTNCQIVTTCASGPCQNGATCYVLGEAVQSEYVCQCTPQYSGRVCQTPREITYPCANNPCGSNGLCGRAANGENAFTCTCAEGWSGQLCTVNIDGSSGQSLGLVIGAVGGGVLVLIVLVIVVVVAVMRCRVTRNKHRFPPRLSAGPTGNALVNPVYQSQNRPPPGYAPSASPPSYD